MSPARADQRQRAADRHRPRRARHQEPRAESAIAPAIAQRISAAPPGASCPSPRRAHARSPPHRPRPASKRASAPRRGVPEGQRRALRKSIRQRRRHLLLVVALPRKDARGPVELLQQDHPHQRVRKGEVGKERNASERAMTSGDSPGSRRSPARAVCRPATSPPAASRAPPSRARPLDRQRHHPVVRPDAAQELPPLFFDQLRDLRVGGPLRLRLIANLHDLEAPVAGQPLQILAAGGLLPVLLELATQSTHTFIRSP